MTAGKNKLDGSLLKNVCPVTTKKFLKKKPTILCTKST